MMFYLKWVRRLIYGMLISLLVLMLPGSALADGGGEATTVTVGRYQVSLVFAEPARTGENSLHVQILDEQGMSVSGAGVEISAMPVEETIQHQENMQTEEPTKGGMDGMELPAAPTAEPSKAMPGMGGSDASPVAMDTTEAKPHDEAITTILEPSEASGEYAGNITFPNAGHWMVSVHLTINGENFEAEFPVDVASGSPSGIILAGFAGFILVIIAIAAISRRKSASA